MTGMRSKPMRRRDTLPRPWNTTLLAAVAEWTRLAEWNLKKNLHSEARRCRERAQGIMAEYLGAKTPEPGTAKTGQVALSHAESHRLLASWGAVELSELRKQWHPCAASGYRDYEPPRDPEARQEREIRRVERDWHEIHRTGWVVLGLKRWQRDALVRHYRDGSPIGWRARRAALDAFGRRWVIWSEAVDGQINPL